MKRLTAVTSALVVALSFGAHRAAADGISWGVNDNAGLYEDGDTVFWNTMLGLGLTTNTITLFTLPAKGVISLGQSCAASDAKLIQFGLADG